MPQQLFLGFDPGGKNGFGVAAIIGRTTCSSTVSSIDQAFEWAVAQVGDAMLMGVGIDSLLHWSADVSGDRPADRELRRRYPAARGSVIYPNSLYGAMVIGGMGLALRVRDRWPSALLNETHPKILYHAFAGERYREDTLPAAMEWLFQRGDLFGNRPCNEHEYDALLSAWATRTGMQEQWPNLFVAWPACIQPVPGVRYLWPPSDKRLANPTAKISKAT